MESAGSGDGFRRSKTLVQCAQLAKQDSYGPAIGCDVMHGKNQHVLFVVESQQRGS